MNPRLYILFLVDKFMTYNSKHMFWELLSVLLLLSLLSENY